MSVCCCTLAGTAACRTCPNNQDADRPPVVRTNITAGFDPILITGNKTNADRIRQMSDYELATLFGDACACLYDDADVCEKYGGACDRCFLDWLKQEVSDAELD